MAVKYYDTSSLLKLQEKAFDDYFITSSIVIQELENIKTGVKKAEDIRYAARKLARMFDTNENYTIIVHTSEHDKLLEGFSLPITNDNIILACAHEASQSSQIDFYSEDVILRLTAKNVFGFNVCRQEVDVKETYNGYKEVNLSEDEMAEFYSNLDVNTYECLVNEYLVVCDDNGLQVGVCKWNGSSYVELSTKSLKTVAFGDRIKPKDIYQRMVVDSIMTNTITVIGGKAGSGKSLLSLVSAMQLIESSKYNRLVILFNPTSARGASKLGFYAGDMLEKAMQTSIGNILSTKFGDRFEVERMLRDGKLKLVSMADCRGMEIRDNEILYISEAQNSDVTLLKLCLSRASQGAKVIIEGDYTNQLDDAMFEGSGNGMRRAIEVLKGEDIFGFVELKNIWRSHLAELIERM